MLNTRFLRQSRRISCLLFFTVAQAVLAQEKLPTDIKWLTNDSDPVYADPQAKRGGHYTEYVTSFPLTLRVVGPDSNGGFRSFVTDNQFGLIGVHPNTENVVPEIATHWAYGKDKKTMYFKINPKAQWSDGKPVTADDFVFTLEFMRSKEIVAPWYNDHYTKEIDKVIVYDSHTIGVVATKALPELHFSLGLSPTPRHFYGKLSSDFVKKFNWQIVPNTGPYQIDEIKKGQFITFKRKKDWWGDELRLFKHRFNVDKVTVKVIRDASVAFEYFRKGELDTFAMTMPIYWYDKSKIPEIEHGYVNRLWFYTDSPQPSMGMWMNQDFEPFKDINVRLGMQHAMAVDKMIQTVLRGDYDRLPQHYAGYGKFTNAAVKARPFDLKKAEGYFTKAGYTTRGPDGILLKDGKRLAFTVTYPTAEHTPRLVFLKEEAKKAGVELNLQLLDGGAAWKKQLEKKHEIAWTGFSTDLRPAYWEHYHSENANKPQTNNFTGTDNKELDKLIIAQRDTTDLNEQIKLGKKIQEIVHEEAGFIPMYMVPYFRQAYWRYWRTPKVAATKLSDSAFAPFGSATGGLFWFDEELKKETQAAMKSGKKFEAVTIVDKTFKAK
jgi:microcin C transport system substrate-binding protein